MTPTLTPPAEHTKQAWRRCTRALRRELTSGQSAEERTAQGGAIGDHALTLIRELRHQQLPDAADPLAGACITAYEAWDVEPPTEQLIEKLTAAGVVVLVPVTLPDLTLDWRDAMTPDVAENWLGPDAITRADLIITPGQAVDARTGVRLGQGGGCYDRALPHRRPGVPVLALLNDHEAGAWDLPHEATDVAVDGVITASGVFWITPQH